MPLYPLIQDSVKPFRPGVKVTHGGGNETGRSNSGLHAKISSKRLQAKLQIG
jgi:hypothetical protein